MRDRSSQYQVKQHNIVTLSSSKKIGSYLVDAGLLSTDQISVVLNDQQATGMRFGEIVVARGWVKEKTVEWIMEKVIEPERQQGQPQPIQSRVATPNSAQAASWSKGQPHPSAPAAVHPAVTHPAAVSPAPTTAKPLSIKSVPVVSAAALQSLSTPTPESNLSPNENKAGSKSFTRREVPIAKPLPSVNSSDGDVNWVG